MLLFLGSILVPFVAIAGAYEDMLKAVNQRDSVKVSHLLQRGMDVNTTDPMGNTLLMLAARNGDFHILEVLLTNSANILKKKQI